MWFKEPAPCYFLKEDVVTGLFKILLPVIELLWKRKMCSRMSDSVSFSDDMNISLNSMYNKATSLKKNNLRVLRHRKEGR